MPENGICVAHGGGSGDDARVAVVVVPGDDGDSDATTTTLSVPTWLDKSFLEHAYGAHLGEPVHIESLAIEAATAKGENYASAMYRIKTTYSTQQDRTARHTLSCIVKSPYAGGFGLDLLSQMDVYDKELVMYETVLPRLRSALVRHAVADAELVANTIHVSHATKAIVFEDLALQGFRMPARSDGLDAEHARRALHKLAVFHAGCAHLHERDATVFQKHFRHGMLNRNDRAFDNFYLTSLDALRDLIAPWPGFGAYASKLAALRPHLLERGRRAFDAKPGQFHTLIHGDIWVNNTMYTYRSTGDGDGDERPDRTMLVDFQFCCWASPTVDLHYFFNTSLREELRQHRQDELLQYYHSVLTATLAALGYAGAVPTLHAFHVDFMQNAFYGFISSCLVQPIMLNEDTEDADIAALHGSDERALRFKRMMYGSAKVQAIVRSLLPIFDRRGLLD